MRAASKNGRKHELGLPLRCVARVVPAGSDPCGRCFAKMGEVSARRHTALAECDGASFNDRHLEQLALDCSSDYRTNVP